MAPLENDVIGNICMSGAVLIIQLPMKGNSSSSTSTLCGEITFFARPELWLALHKV